MKLYFSGVPAHPRIEGYEFFKTSGLNERPDVGYMVSYAYIDQYWVMVANGLTDFALDSGAFSVATKGRTIAVEEYCAFIAEHRHLFELVVSLDVIGNQYLSMTNWDQMREIFADVMPVFHLGEELSTLRHYCDNCDYVGLGGMAMGGTSWRSLNPVLEAIFSLYPDKRFHAFGATSPKTIRAFPFYSADSSAWLIGGRFGRIILPDGEQPSVGPRHQHREIDAEATGLADWLRERGIPYPVPEDYPLRNLNYVNAQTMVDILCDQTHTHADVRQSVLF